MNIKKISISKKKILCFIQDYIPGFASGGPVTSVVNFVQRFGQKYDILIICSGFDPSNKIYNRIKLNAWNKVGGAKVFYISNKLNKYKTIYQLLNKTDYDLLYFNSYFNFTFSIFPILIQFFRLINLKSIIIAPRGELSKNAIRIKKIKKIIYIKLTNLFGLYKNVCWQASSIFEQKDIIRELNSDIENVFIAPDLNFLNFSLKKKIYVKNKKILRLIFLSRISPMKNLDYLLEVLKEVSTPIMLRIIGPKEDLNYWKKCKKIIENLPKNILVKVSNEIAPEKVRNAFAQHDLFVFPTRGENFGHVIPECLSAGTPILLSDNTSWKNDRNLGLQILSLKDKKDWVKTIENWSNLSKNNILKRKNSALKYYKNFKKMNKDSINKNKILFEYKISCLN